MTNNYTNEILNLLRWLEHKARTSENQNILSFNIVNNTKKIVPYNQALLWTKHNNKFEIKTAAATTIINRNAPFILCVEKFVLPHIYKENKNKPKMVSIEELKDGVKHYQVQLTNYFYYIPFVNKDGKIKAGLLFLNNEQWANEPLTLLNTLSETYAHTWYLLEKREKSSHKTIIQSVKNKKVYIILAIIAVMFFPINQSVLAPAEVAPSKPDLVSASINGVIKEIYVEPNQEVKKGQELFMLDTITLKNKYEQAQKELSIAEERYRKAYQHAYDTDISRKLNAESKEQILILKYDILKAQENLKYSKEILDRSVIHAKKDGIIIFSDPKEWLGRPVKIGDKVMFLANLNKKELDISLPVDNLIQLRNNAEVRFYSSVDPLHPINATMHYISKKAEKQPNDTLAYHAVAYFDKDQTLPRMGIRGTAKIYGKKVTVFYYLFRRPIYFLRRTLGI